MQSFTVKFADQHSNLLTYAGIYAYNKQAALWLAISAQFVQMQISNNLTVGDTLTVTITQP